MLAKLGRNEEALKKFDQSLTCTILRITYALFNKGLVLAKMGRYTEAKDAFEKSRKSFGSWVPLLGSYREAANTYDIARGIPHPEETPDTRYYIVSQPIGISNPNLYLRSLN